MRETAPKPSIVETAYIVDAMTMPENFPPALPAYSVGDEWNQPAADVLDILARAAVPLLHTALVGALAERGYTKAKARAAIAGAQERRWIEHNLTTGYELSGKEEASQ